MTLSDATAELCAGGLADDQAMTDILSVAAQPSDRGPGDELGSMSLAAATSSSAFFSAPYFSRGPLLERYHRANPVRPWGHRR